MWNHKEHSVITRKSLKYSWGKKGNGAKKRSVPQSCRMPYMFLASLNLGVPLSHLTWPSNSLDQLWSQWGTRGGRRGMTDILSTQLFFSSIKTSRGLPGGPVVMNPPRSVRDKEILCATMKAPGSQKSLRFHRKLYGQRELTRKKGYRNHLVYHISYFSW